MKELESFPLLLLFWNAASLTLSICFIRTVIVCGEIKSPQRLIETLVQQLQLWPSSPHWIWTARRWKHAGPAARISQSETATTVTSKKQQQKEKVILEILHSFTGNNGSNFNLLSCYIVWWCHDSLMASIPSTQQQTAGQLSTRLSWFSGSDDSALLHHTRTLNSNELCCPSALMPLISALGHKEKERNWDGERMEGRKQ